MSISYQKHKGDVLAGCIGFRAPDGSIIETKPFYRPAPGLPAKTGCLTAEDMEVCEGIVSLMVEKFGEYIRGVEALENAHD